MQPKLTKTLPPLVTILQDPSGHPNSPVTIVHPDPQIGEHQVTAEQFRALHRKYDLCADGANSFEEFLSRVTSGGVGTDSYILVHWCGMWLGIEKDGYTHS